MDGDRIFPVIIAFLCGVMLVLLFSGCQSPAPDGTPDEVPALDIVLGVYGEPGPPPRVVWVDGTPECSHTAWIQDGKCVDGMFQDGTPDRVFVARWPGAALSQTAACHETLHWTLFRRNADWKSHPPEFYSLVARAQEVLWRSGN